MGLLLLLLLLGWFPPREDGKGALNIVVVSGTLSGLDVCAAAEGLLMGLSAADEVEGGEGDYSPDAGVDGGEGGVGGGGGLSLLCGRTRNGGRGERGINTKTTN